MLLRRQWLTSPRACRRELTHLEVPVQCARYCWMVNQSENRRELTHLEVPVHDAVEVAVVDRLEDLLDAVRRVRLAVELPRHDVLEQLASGDTVGPREPSSARTTGPVSGATLTTFWEPGRVGLSCRGSSRDACSPTGVRSFAMNESRQEVSLNGPV